MLVIMLILGMSVPVFATSRNQDLPSSFSDEELLTFLENYDLDIPDKEENRTVFLSFARNIIQQVEKQPDVQFAFNNTAMLKTAKDIKNAVNNYYGNTKVKNTRGVVSGLQDNTVYGEWDDEYETYNGYGYAIGYYSNIDPGRIKWINDGNAASDFYYNEMANIYTIAGWVKGDLESLGRTVGQPTTTMPSTSVGGHANLICIRKDTTGYPGLFGLEYDYHLMRKGSDGYWYHKPGETNPLRYKYIPTNSRIWVTEGYTGQMYFRDEDLTYESEIYFISYTTPHSWKNEYYGNDRHIQTCTICGITTGTPAMCMYVNDRCRTCGHVKLNTIDNIDVPHLYE